MSEVKKYTKKLTDAGNAVCVLSAISFVLSLLSALTEPIATAAYNSFYTKQQDHFLVTDFKGFVDVYEKSVMLAVLSLIVFSVAVSGRNKKKIGGGFCVFTLIIPALMAVKPIILISQTVSDGTFTNAFQNGSDGDKFREAVSLSTNVVPVLCAFFLLLCGVVLTGRILCEDFTAEVPLMKRMNVTQPQNEKVAAEKPLVSDEPVKIVEPQFEFTHDLVDSDSPFRKPDGNVKSVSVEISSETEKGEDETVTKENSDELICKECGEKLADGAKFCKNCGRPVF